MALNQFPRRAFSGAATLQTFTGNGSTTVFTLNESQYQNECFVYVDDVAQVPGVDFGINGTSLTFTSAPANNAEIIVRGFGVPTPLNSVSDGAITTVKIAESAITHSKLHTTAIQDKLGYTPVSPTQLTTEINNLIAAAPGALNTLDELAAALGDDANFATTITNALATKANTTDVNNALALKANISSLATVAASGSYSDLLNKPSLGKSKKQKVQNSIDTITLNVGSWTTVVSVNITVSAGSDVLVMFNGEQNAVAGAAWQWTALFRDNTQLGTTTIEVNQEGWNSNFHTHWWDENLPAGTYTYSFKVTNGSNYCQWGEHSEPTIQAIEFGV